jgi:uncharacterized SAM-binding protein YcdF (DUF218 family)
MFHVSRLFWLLVQPLSLAFFLVTFGCVALILGFRKSGVTLSVLASGILFVTLFTTTGDVALQALEERFPKPGRDPERVSCMIVLGGAFSSQVNTARGGIEMNQSADRFVETLRLALAYPQAKILISGGDGSFSGTYEGDGVTAERFFPAFGVSTDRLLRDTTSRNTAENVENTRALLASAGLSDCLLITSAFHMPRSIGLMRKTGLSVIPWSTDYRTDGKTRLGIDLTQPTLNAQQTATALREWIGLVAYRLMGRTDALLPG